MCHGLALNLCTPFFVLRIRVRARNEETWLLQDLTLPLLSQLETSQSGAEQEHGHDFLAEKMYVCKNTHAHNTHIHYVLFCQLK